MNSIGSETAAEKTAMEDDLPTEYDVVVVGTGIDFYQYERKKRIAPYSPGNEFFSSMITLTIMIPDRYDRVHRRRSGKQNRQKGSTPGQVMTGRHLSFSISFCIANYYPILHIYDIHNCKDD